MTNGPAPSLKTERTTLRRRPNKGVYDRDSIYAILDEAFVCHVGFVQEGQPFVIPTGYGRDGDTLYLHGSSASRMMRALAEEIPICVTVTLVDALVLARSVFNHSVNHRSVVVLGKAALVEGEEKMHGLTVLTNHIVPGRWDDVRPPTDLEMKATSLLKMRIDEASAKIRSGPPADDDEDYALPYWGGIVPVRTVTEPAVDDGRLLAGVELPSYLVDYSRIRPIEG
ncbi:pyridoxamine 5'-phosphate oxidase family protein [Xanthobacter dioxanivorans]|uniref:Pyridoxamine 5'-phosphate oxidase family protein n=2 Tax=Xanthobacter dioxanivorans TaxID=2528964 RepID=A0A974PV39_9HYPH|nr:pyridoxamine 5'-phosphate oxidase family protein [Xanthobacter dioxanivorans]